MRTLLLADESLTVQRVIALTFADQDIRVVSVADGQQAMERMAAETPDIVLAGTTLPHVSGYDLASFMRSKPDLRNVPVLLLAGAFENTDEARLAASGANGILEKPVEPTVVIGRVKELLGLKSDEKPAAPAGRMITPAKPPTEKKLPVPPAPRAVTSTKGTPSKWEQLRKETLEPNTKSVEDSSTGRGDYLDTLDAAFDTLDQHLQGRVPATKMPPRNPAGPLGQSGSTSDPRSPGPRGNALNTAPGNPVYEVDDDWFGDGDSKTREDARAGRREIAEDLSDPELLPAKPKKAESPIYEVDDEWFKEDDKARAAKAVEQQQLAAEMGIHDVELPEVPTPVKAPSDLDFDFLDEFNKKVTSPEPATKPVAELAKPEPVKVEPAKVEPPKAEPAKVEAPKVEVSKVTAAKVEPSSVEPARVEPPRVEPAPVVAAKVADDFDALLAFERGERALPPMPPPPEIKVVTPEITDAMLDQIAARVADRLSASAFGEQLRNAMTATMRETVNETVSATVRPVVSETSERVVREVVSKTVEGVVRDVVSQTAEKAVREVVSETTERVVREVVPDTAERAVRDVVTQTAERTVPDAVTQTTERVVREVVAQSSDRAVREVVFETSERLVREEIERIKSRRQ